MMASFVGAVLGVAFAVSILYVYASHVFSTRIRILMGEPAASPPAAMTAAEVDAVVRDPRAASTSDIAAASDLIAQAVSPGGFRFTDHNLVRLAAALDLHQFELRHACGCALCGPLTSADPPTGETMTMTTDGTPEIQPEARL
jgi:hypothetical protein